ncbi:hypothetical protein NERG_02569 [Nematocida ausubeli]|uniref:Uncharacterized protein n=1 Tax=Nematocida ausubeli (strain ATCC PRA-371 / ERTm2) TaxID=1913371 RepID=H8ZG48_NEMA1|nr:hypothetical protein NERG_02569 [Nematocida ausubeli]
MEKKSRNREIPVYEAGDMILREDTSIDEKLLKEIEISKTVVVIDSPCKGYLEQMQKEITDLFPEATVSLITENTKIEAAESEIEGTVLCTYTAYAGKCVIAKGKKDFIFVNIRRSMDKKEIISQNEKRGTRFYFVSNVYKIESTQDLERAGIKRILPIKNGFGLARTPIAFTRRHEIVYAGASHLRRNAFIIALERNITVPCVITAETADEVQEVIESIERVETLMTRHTTEIGEYLERKKWIYILTHADLCKKIKEGFLTDLKKITKSSMAYGATDKTVYLMSLHQIAQSVFTMVTSKDRGKAKKIVEVLPRYGIILEEGAEELKKAFQSEKERKAKEAAEKESDSEEH